MDLARVLEKVGAMDAKLTAAHQRVDKLETGVREDLKELRVEFRELAHDVKALNAHMNRGKGWAAAIILLSGCFGAGLVEIVALLIK